MRSEDRPTRRLIAVVLADKRLSKGNAAFKLSRALLVIGLKATAWILCQRSWTSPNHARYGDPMSPARAICLTFRKIGTVTT